MDDSTDSPSPGQLSQLESLYLFHHVFLPPKLPQEDDYDAQYEGVLLEKVVDALHGFSHHAPSQCSGVISTVITTVDRLRAIRGASGDLCAEKLTEALKELETQGGLLPIHVLQQNAAILLTRKDDTIHVESFQLSPRNMPVMSTIGRLVRVFPNLTLALDLQTFKDLDFQSTLAQTLSSMSHESVAGTKARVWKSDEEHDEDRDATDPKMVTDFMMAFIRPRCADAEALQIQKHTREEVNWFDCRSPWRRSALWLLVRVILQLAFRRLSNQERANDLYKQFMVYFMTSILETSSTVISCEMVYLMNAKIARRLLKLKLSDEPAWFPIVQRTLTQTSDMIKEKWRETQNQSSIQLDLYPLTKLEFDHDVYCNLPGLDDHLENIKKRDHGQSLASTKYLPQTKLMKYPESELPTGLDFVDDDYLWYKLAAFEEWVELFLDDWIELHLKEESTCHRISDVMTRYHQAAFALYSTNAEAESVMLLTLLELWIACDNSATEIHDFLEDYDPCIPIDIFQSLLLPFKSQMSRLVYAESELRSRYDRFLYSGPGIFRDFGTKSCFSVRYFDQSDDHKRLYKEIQDQASNEQAQKRSELQAMKQQYQELHERANKRHCDTYTPNFSDRQYHSKFCIRCDLQKQADNMTIKIHEWPLSNNLLQAKSTVFELKIPESFGCWRDATVYFLLAVLKVEYDKQEDPRAQYPLQSVGALGSFYTPIEGVNSQRIGLLSQDKPHENTHRVRRDVANATENDVCLQSGVHFKYFDHHVGCFVGEFDTTLQVAESCTYKLPLESSSLQQFLFRPADEPDGPSPNTVIASQSAAPKHIQLAEYKSLATIPLGVDIQWQNILVELCSPSVDFKKIETGIFFRQAIHQAGPPQGDSELRQGHSILANRQFAITLLSRIEQVTERLRENWELVQGLSVLISLVLRVLELSSLSDIHNLCFECLRNLRQIAWYWLGLVRKKVSKTTNDTRKTSFVAKCVHIALICTDTFNTGSLDQTFATSADISTFIQCCMLIQDWKQTPNTKSDQLLSISYYRWRVLTYRCHSILADMIVHKNDPGLNAAIQGVWRAYRAGSKWSKALKGTDCWLVTRSVCQIGDDIGMLVHYNLLTGELLVNGLPLARLPSDYECKQAYPRLFGKSQLEVMPSDSLGFQFSCQKQYRAHTVHLGTQIIPGSDELELSVKAVDQTETWEFLPSRLFQGLFPNSFVRDYVHWYAVNGGYVEFRPASSPWKSSKRNWRLEREQLQGTWFLQKRHRHLISVKSQTAKLISLIFGPVEQGLELYCSVHKPSMTLEIDLPCLRMGFSLEPKCTELRCRQYPSMSIDADQSLDTLIGFSNKLILLDRNTQDRVLLIPESEVSWRQNGNHVEVETARQLEAKVHVYSIDDNLGRLVDNGSLESKLFLSYLHALTSSCLPDPLTRKTGTEQALCILRSASMRSFSRLESEHTKVLAKIAALTPARCYYPANEQVMQKVDWQQDLAPLSQHSDFYKEVREIFDQDSRLALFHPDSSANHSLPLIEENLWKRDRIRVSSFRISGFGAEYHTQDHDLHYRSLDLNRDSDEGDRVFTLCKMIYDEIPRIRDIDPANAASHLWNVLRKQDKVNGPTASFDTARIKYDAELTLDPTGFIASHWCILHRVLCSTRSRLNKFQVMICLSSMAFSENADMIPLEVIASLYVMPKSSAVSPPTRGFFCPDQGYMVDESILRTHLQSAYNEDSITPERYLIIELGESKQQFHSRVAQIRSNNRKLVVERILKHLKEQWPTSSPSFPEDQGTPKPADYVKIQQALNSVQKSFKVWHDNLELWRYLKYLMDRISRRNVQVIEMPQYLIQYRAHKKQQKRGFIAVDDLFSCAPSLELPRPELRDLFEISSSDMTSAPNLLALVEALGSQARSEYEKWYVEQLRSSFASLQRGKKAARITLKACEVEDAINDYLHQCQVYHERIYTAIISQMSLSTPLTGVSESTKPISVKLLDTLASLNHLPRFSPMLLLEQLSRCRWHHLSVDWKDWLSSYGRSITDLQRAKRLASFIGNHDELLKELQNPGHENWEPFDYPESLLLEIENGIMIRDVQEEIASQMREFKPGENAVMQLNMGEGKSSVIVPIVAAALANESCLVRVLVAKPQSQQMFQMLVSKLGGLLGRRVYQMPVSRSLKLEQEQADDLERMCRECMAQGGVLLIQPEHILSLKLMCLESFINEKPALGRSLLRILQFFHDYSRDVVDESDENFNVKFELIYTMGSQTHVEFSPHRWVLIQRVLDVLREYAPGVMEEYPRSIEVDKQQLSGFPRIRLLRRDAEEALFERVATHICKEGILSLPISRQPKTVRDAVLKYVMKQDLTPDEIAAVEDPGARGFWTENTKTPLLLLRGLLAGGVLAFCLGQKRWRVNYGPDPNRYPPTKLCVPYRAKDNPSARSEFSHPDVIIILTSLNYYYAGLGDEDLFLAFNHLVDSDEADTEYQEWVRDAPALALPYRQLVGVNLDDRHHCTEHIFPALRFSKSAIDYFLSHVVFPKEMKEFPHKLSASGWDIGEIKKKATVGFSGTNDSRKTLPLSVKQLDQPEQNHTNALVLEYLLQTENTVALQPEEVESGVSDAHLLLNMVSSFDPPAQVILDVGAQILELTNVQVAKHWLKILPKNGPIQAIVFVDDNDHICVIDRKGRIEPLQISPFAQQMEACYVFLDEAHTRGIDLKLPPSYRAAVTLGPGITKDKLVQACMRMRKLGKGQSVVFCIPKEIRFKILALRGKQDKPDITVPDVLSWAVSETWIELCRSMPLWAVQGRRNERQRGICDNSSMDNSLELSESQAESFLEPECQTLQHRYRPGYTESTALESPDNGNQNLRLIDDRCREFGNLNFASSVLQEEQERELAPEIEVERQVQRPPITIPRAHKLHVDLRSFVVTGQLTQQSDAYLPAFRSLSNTSAASFMKVKQFPTGLLVTTDFSMAVVRPSKLDKGAGVFDAFQRPVRWILTSSPPSSANNARTVTHMIIISPYEARRLLPDIRRSKCVTLHQYAPRQNFGFDSLDKLSLYNIPEDSGKIEIPDDLRIQLNLFAGQLYLDSYSEYQRLCDFLGLASVPTHDGLRVDVDGFIRKGTQTTSSPFTKSPVKFLKVLMSQIRKDSQDCDKTHIGRILNGLLLSPSDFADPN